MAEVKGSGRGYRSPLRAQQAAATRLAVISAATELFVAKGYGATTVDDVARRAGVSKPTVFTAVGNKAALLSAVRDVAMAGDDLPVAVSDRPPAQQVVEEPDPARAVELLAGVIAGINLRYAAINEAIRGAAAAGEPAARELWETSEAQRLAGARHWTRTLAAKAPLRTDEATTVDLVWLLMAPDNCHRLVHSRGWTTERYREWIADGLTALLATAS
ncbi:helix-turn-helix domain-containing protein [Micromonospora sp. NPDC007271]|uniref:TetR/AcrR family transcriptional regulator n=1 Tax=Micromonospora sp. NPDC007271 TaxID=3154587 RepID=UPI0033EEB404